MCVLLVTHILCLERRLGNHTRRMAVVTQTDLPKSLRNRCVINVLLAFCVVNFFFNFLLV